jgi:hypothetical protein
MNSYDVYIDDIYERNRTKKITVREANAFLAHKQGLKATNALREEISRVVCDNRVVYTFGGGFNEE